MSDAGLAEQSLSRTVQTPILTIVIPAYNACDYLTRAVNSVIHVANVEVIIVNDGSTDETAQMAEELAAKHPQIRVIHQENRGHGGAVNTGIANARGTYVRVVDADDWLQTSALVTLVGRLKDLDVDVCITNYTYEKVGKRRKHTVRYANIFPINQICGWQDTHHFRYDQYVMMHALTYRTEVVRRSQLQLPEHMFYVDYLFAFVPLAYTRRLIYLDLDLYRYFIGRDDQSVQEQNMIARVHQLVHVNEQMVAQMPRREDVPKRLYRYLTHFLRINTVVTAIMLTLRPDESRHRARTALWERMRQQRPDVEAAVGSGPFGRVVQIPGRAGTRVLTVGYRVVVRVMGVN